MNRRSVSLVMCVVVAPFSIKVFSYDFKVFNATPFKIEAYCEKVGVLSTQSVSIAPNDRGSIDCRGGDCITGIKVIVSGKELGWKDVTLHSTWSMRCRDLTAHVIAIPHYSKEEINGKTRYTLTGFRLSVSRNMALSADTEPFTCSQDF